MENVMNIELQGFSELRSDEYFVSGGHYDRDVYILGDSYSQLAFYATLAAVTVGSGGNPLIISLTMAAFLASHMELCTCDEGKPDGNIGYV